MNPDQEVPALALVPIIDDRLETYREALYDHINAPEVYEELTDPHITIHPGFTTTTHGIETICAYLNGRDTLPKVTASAIYAYPSLDDPAVIAVAVHADFGPIRDDIQHILDGYDHDIITEPAPTHVTLLKRRDIEADDVPDEVTERVQTLLADTSPPSGALRLGDPRVEWYNPPYKVNPDS